MTAAVILYAFMAVMLFAGIMGTISHKPKPKPKPSHHTQD